MTAANLMSQCHGFIFGSKRRNVKFFREVKEIRNPPCVLAHEFLLSDFEGFGIWQGIRKFLE